MSDRSIRFPRPDAVVGALLCLLTLFRAWYAGRVELLQDEAYYWQWSRHLDWGYYDNTPLLALVIRLFTALLGSTELGVRAGAIVCALLAALFIYRLAKRLLGPTVAAVAVALANLVPLYGVGAVIATQDPVQVAFWAATLWAVWNALQSRRTVWWLIAGALAGLAALAKLNALLLLPSILLILALSPTWRLWLRRPEPYLAAVLALAIFSPFVGWNHTHENAFWLHIHHMGSRSDAGDRPLRHFWDFLGAQAALVSPLIFLTYLWTLYAARPTAAKDDARLFLWAPSAVVFAATCLVSLRSKVEGNWAVCAYVTGLILVADVLVRLWRSRAGRAWGIVSGAAALFMSAVILFPNPFYAFVKLRPVDDRTNELHGWRTMASSIQSNRTAMGSDPFVFSSNYKLTSEAAFYLPDQPQTESLFLDDRANQYLFWTRPQALLGRDAIFLDSYDENPSDDPLRRYRLLRQIFRRVDPPQILPIMRTPPYREPIRVIILARCYGFWGYDRARWQDGW